MTSAPALRPTQATLGTFAGVFTPSILTILGIVLFLRLGYVVGNAGLGRALLILALANSISILTSLSLSAIATNLKVKRGGDYYLISRTLGLEFGGAIGVVLFIAQSVSVGFYCVGFGEVISSLLPQRFGIHAQVVAAVAIVVLFVFAWLGTDWATRFQYVVMAILVASLLSFFAGGAMRWNNAFLETNWSAPLEGPAFWLLFGLFFPAVTGFTQGVSMSGDLKDPGRSLPRGTLLAVGASIVVYFLAAVVFAAALPRPELVGDYAAMNRIAFVDWLVVAGVMAATLSSAMASFLGAPRILQALAADRIFPFLLPFGKGSGRYGNPRRAVLLCAGIALGTTSLGQLNVIAPVVSMFFLISYGLINYATFFEARAASPSFRPRFHFYDFRVSLLGALICAGAMLAIDLSAGLAAMAILFAVYQYLKRTGHQARWADGRRSYHLQRIRSHLLAAATATKHPRDWRPNMLVFSDDPERRGQLLRFAAWLEGDSGFTTVVKVLEGAGPVTRKRRAETEAELAADIEREKLTAYPLALLAPDMDLGLSGLVQGFGIGPLRANMILLNWVEQHVKADSETEELILGGHLRIAFRLGCNLVVLDGKAREWEKLESTPPNQRRIDVWWRGDATSQMSLLLAYLMKRREPWDEARIRLLGMCGEESAEGTEEDLRQKLEEIRIEAEPKIVVNPTPELVDRLSADASVVFLPFRLRGNQPVGPFGGRLDRILERLPIVALTLAAEDIDLDAEPEEGEAGQAARLQDALADLERLAARTALEAEEAAHKARERRAELDTRQSAGTDDSTVVSELAADVRRLEDRAEKTARRAARAKAKMLDAEQALQARNTMHPES